jgi:hypothetical protein
MDNQKSNEPSDVPLNSRPKRKPGDPLVFIPDGAQLNFDFSPQKPPKTKYNRSVLLMNEQEYQRITGVKNGRDGRDFV